MSRAYPSVRGIRSMTLGFLVGIPTTFLLLFRGYSPNFLSIVLANVLSCVCLILLYDGIVRFVGGKRFTNLLWIAVIPVAAVVYFWSEVRPSIVPRIVAMALFCALIRALTAWTLLRNAAPRDSASRNEPLPSLRKPMGFLGVVLVFLVIAGVLRAVLTVIHGAPANFMQQNSIQTSAVLLSSIYVGVYGFSFLLMVGHDLITRSQQESEKDLLSGAFNRRGIESRLAAELKRSDRSRERLSVALVDIDHFKSINDKFGHATGDEAIRAVAAAISRSLRDSDYLGRYGGDEFLVILPFTACHQAVIAAERLSRAVATIDLPDAIPPMTLSVGITEASPDDDTISLIARADQALYLSKKDGRNRLHSILPKSTFPDPIEAPQPQSESAAVES